jgi:hypothetical protein
VHVQRAPVSAVSPVYLTVGHLKVEGNIYCKVDIDVHKI